MERLRPSLQPGFLVPALLAATLVVDVALRWMVPVDRVSYRVWEAMRAFGAEAPFRAHARYDRPRVYGNLAAIGNVPDLRRYHRIVFTSDSLGYHNAPELAARGGVAALLFGSSFAAGTEVNDDETLAAQLTRLTGSAVYNAAPGDPAPARLEELADRLGMERGVVIYEYVEGSGAPPIDAVPPDAESVRCRAMLGPWSTPAICARLTRLRQRLRISPLAVFAARAHRRVEDDRWLPNRSADRVLRRRLVNGREMLFLAEERGIIAQAQLSEAPVARYAAWLGARLALQHRELLVVLVPQKYTVYGPLLERSGGAALPDDGGYVDRLEARLRERGIAVVNVTGPLRDAARTALARDTYVYWLDDTHWNAAGVRVAAEAVAPELGRLWARQTCSESRAKDCAPRSR